MHKFWFTFNEKIDFSPLNLGCGVTAISEEDAIKILRDIVILDKGLTVKSCILDVDLSSLDDHVRPNVGNVFVRGVWFPMGYSR